MNAPSALSAFFKNFTSVGELTVVASNVCYFQAVGLAWRVQLPSEAQKKKLAFQNTLAK
jgi:hypothetical protein